MILFAEIPLKGQAADQVPGQSGASVSVYVRERKGSSRITMSFSTKERHVVISAPKRTTKTFLRDFITTHMEWIEKQVTKHGAVAKAFAPGVVVPYKGKPHTLTHEESNKVLVKPDGDSFFVRAAITRIDTHVRRWLLKEATDACMDASFHFAKALDVSVAKITMKAMHTRWGSCSSSGNLNYNWRLILAPEEVLTYVCAHEVAHRVHMNHSKAFWDTVAKIYPAHAPARAWLKKNGSSLYAFG
ncbi:MAG: SprT family zinc-dependent metalloprotease [Pseudomonadota bacterium]